MFNFQNHISRDLAQASHGDSRNLFYVRPVALRVQFLRDQCFNTLFGCSGTSLRVPADQAFRLQVEQPLWVPADQPFRLSADQPFRLPTDQPFRLIADQPFRKPADQPFRLPTDQPFRLPTDQPFRLPTDQSGLPYSYYMNTIRMPICPPSENMDTNPIRIQTLAVIRIRIQIRI